MGSCGFRATYLHRRRVRKAKLRQLRARYKTAKTEADREKILEKVRRIASWVPKEQFLQPLEAPAQKAQPAPAGSPAGS